MLNCVGSLSTIVRLTPSTAIEPFEAICTANWRGTEIQKVDHSPLSSRRSSLPTPSMCPLTKWPPSRSPTARARSRFTRAAGLQFAEIGAGERLRAGLEGERLALAVDHRQAAAVDRDAVGHPRLGGDLRLADDQPAAGRLVAQFHDRAEGFNDTGKHRDTLLSSDGRQWMVDVQRAKKWLYFPSGRG